MMKWPWRDQFKPVVPALEKCIRENLSNAASLVNIEENNEPNKMIFVHGMYFCYLIEVLKRGNTESRHSYWLIAHFLRVP